MPAAAVFASGSSALITGGASGVGLAIAKLCRSKGMNILLVDVNAEALQTAKKQLVGEDDAGSDVVTAAADVSNAHAWTELSKTATSAFSTIELLVLNAGVGIRGTWGDDEYFSKTNLFGVVYGINAFLPVVQQASETRPTAIVITGSKQGITNPPGNPAYNASKSAVKTLAEHLSWDLRGTNTSVHLLVPGWTFTGMTRGGNTEKPAGAWAPQQVAEYLYRKMQDDKFYVICPDNDVSEETDKKRMLWSVGDIVNERPPLTRWRDEWKREAEETMAKTNL
ncbi:1-deoxy-11-beta-hydroxypentalenate dehydrogenase [Metarhizium anisopliae]|nr:1-deoxy-11-beta-hydroxypentalenate dehydrogenase [Metarhizium anisopliae]